MLIIFCTEFTPRHYQLLTEKSLYQGLHQRKYTHYAASGCGPIMACEVIHLWTKCGFIMCHICWLVCICEGKYFASRRCLRIWADSEGRCYVKSPHFQMPQLSGYNGCILIQLFMYQLWMCLFCNYSVQTIFSLFVFGLDWIKVDVLLYIQPWPPLFKSSIDLLCNLVMHSFCKVISSILDNILSIFDLLFLNCDKSFTKFNKN